MVEGSTLAVILGNVGSAHEKGLEWTWGYEDEKGMKIRSLAPLGKNWRCKRGADLVARPVLGKNIVHTHTEVEYGWLN